MKTFFGDIFISKESLEEAGIEYPIKLEYYTILEQLNIKNKYGIEIVKTEYINGKKNIENKQIKNITSNLEEQRKILELLKNNEVTPIGLEDVLKELIK